MMGVFMRKTWHIAIAVLIGSGSFSSLRAAQAQGPLAPATVKISLEKSTITQHEPTILDIAIHNSSATGLDFDPGYDKERIDVRLTDPEGRIWKRQRASAQEGIKFSNAVHLEPGEAGVVSVLLNNWFSIGEVGNYRIEVTLYSPRSPSQKVDGVNATLMLTVLPRDEGMLESACADTVKKITDPRSSSAAIVAAEALSKVDDPVAVPFLVEAMKRREFIALMIGSLARLKTDDAVNALVSASRSSDPETRSLAHSALVGLGRASERQQ